MREERIIARVKLLVENFTHDQPFSKYLNHFFRLHPEMGSNDRRNTRDLCFAYFRIGLILQEWSFEKRLSLACYLWGDWNSSLQKYLLKKYLEIEDTEEKKSLEERISQISKRYESFKLEDIFPLNDLLSEKINKKKWYFSFLHKPRVWIRIRKEKIKEVTSELISRSINFKPDLNACVLSFDQGIDLENTESWKKGFFEIQDINSQKTIDFIAPENDDWWWDACAGSGGKSLLLLEHEPKLKIIATDSRKNILNNYLLRLQKSGAKNYETAVADLADRNIFNEKIFDGILADVPCSGSGTWSRSPEWLRSDSRNLLKDHFVPLQRKIVKNILPSLKIGKPLIYITCSVFRNENEDNVAFFEDNLPLKLENSIYLKGYEAFADTLFVARFIRLS
jgi:16S rRNA (cytosine967-C5)-methyltransferase